MSHPTNRLTLVFVNLHVFLFGLRRTENFTSTLKAFTASIIVVDVLKWLPNLFWLGMYMYIVIVIGLKYELQPRMGI